MRNVLLLLSLDKLKTRVRVTYTHEHWVKMYVESKGLSNHLPPPLRERQSAERQSTNTPWSFAMAGIHCRPKMKIVQEVRRNLAASRIAPSKGLR